MRDKIEGVTRATAPGPSDPLEELADLHSEDALLRWAIAALPHRTRLEPQPRAALDAAFRARAEALGASSDWILAFANDSPKGETPLAAAPPESGDDHAAQAPL